MLLDVVQLNHMYQTTTNENRAINRRVAIVIIP